MQHSKPSETVTSLSSHDAVPCRTPEEKTFTARLLFIVVCGCDVGVLTGIGKFVYIAHGWYMMCYMIEL